MQTVIQNLNNRVLNTQTGILEDYTLMNSFLLRYRLCSATWNDSMIGFSIGATLALNRLNRQLKPGFLVLYSLESWWYVCRKCLKFFFLCTKLLMLTLTIEKDKDIHTLHAENVTQGNCCSRKKSHKILRYLCDNFFA